MTSGGDSACSWNVGIARLDRAEQILVPLERQIGVVAALQQQLAAAERDRLVDLAEDLLEPEHVAFGRADRTVERAEVAARHADVRVVDVAVDDVGDDPARDACARGCRRPAGRAAPSARADRARAPRRDRRAPPPCDAFAQICSWSCVRAPGTGQKDAIGSQRVDQLVLVRQLVETPQPRPARRSPSAVLDIVPQIALPQRRRAPARSRRRRSRRTPRRPRRAPRRSAATPPARQHAGRPAQNAHTNGSPVIAVHSSPEIDLRRPSAPSGRGTAPGRR